MTVRAEHRVCAPARGRRLPRALRDRAPRRARARRSSPAASGSASRSPARSRGTRRCCCSTSLSSALDAHTKTTVRAELHELLAELDIPVCSSRTTSRTRPRSPTRERDRRRAAAPDGTPAELVARPASVRRLVHRREPAARPRRVDAQRLRACASSTARWSAPPTRARRGRAAVYPWDVTLAATQPDDSALNVIHAPIRSIAQAWQPRAADDRPITAEITAESRARLGSSGQSVYASFKATGTRVVAEHPHEEEAHGAQHRNQLKGKVTDVRGSARSWPR